jgi:uncharacterized protein
MRHIPRLLTSEVLKAAKAFPAVILTGPRRTGKTTLLRRCFPKASYILLEDPDIIQRAKEDPRSFLDGLKLPVILDEIQYVPQLLNYIRTRIDEKPRERGRWLITGSQEFALMKGVTESMAGRAAILELMTLSEQEFPRVSFCNGGFPESLSAPARSELWFKSYIQTYLERDVRTISTVKDLPAFRRFMSLLASRVGQQLNKSDLAAPLGVSVPTIAEWIRILEVSKQLLLVEPYFENFGKRIVKSPKIYFADGGLLCHLLGVSDRAALMKSSFYGPVFENFVAAEIVKDQVNRGKRKDIYYFRSQQGVEVDFIVPRSVNRIDLIEVKVTSTPSLSMAAPMLDLRPRLAKRGPRLFLVHQPSPSQRYGGRLGMDVVSLSVHDYIRSVSRG